MNADCPRSLSVGAPCRLRSAGPGDDSLDPWQLQISPESYPQASGNKCLCHGVQPVMRLLSRQGEAYSFTTESHPYAILSHTWGSEQEEVSYQDVLEGCLNKTGSSKLRFCLEQAFKDGFGYVWIDTCCIDRRDKNELGESINRMFDYYAKAEVCYVYLSDVPAVDLPSSRWFSRGWTLQELIAPRLVKFFSSDLRCLGSRESLGKELLKATGIDSTPLSEVPLEQRFSWSLGRQTSKLEDQSYSMLGLLDVTMIPNYGEGEAARSRLFDILEREYGRRTVKKIEDKIKEWQDSRKHASSEPQACAHLMQSLFFETMDSQRLTINDAYRDTCAWLLKRQDFQDWLAAKSSSFYWIKGKPGAGKSTLMKYALQAVPLAHSFFFNGRGSQLEKSVLGLYRSLLYQIISEAEDLQNMLIAQHTLLRRTNIHWTAGLIKDCFRSVVRTFTTSRFFFIDALDECSSGDVQDMIYFFEDLGCSNLRICFASRFYPTIVIKSSVEMLVDNAEHDQDIVSYVHGRLDVPETERGQTLRHQVTQKANGVFFWAVLVVKLLNGELSNGNIFNVEQTLSSLPSGMSELLKDIVLREQGDTERFRYCIQWLLFARTPLTSREFYYAMMTSLHRVGLVRTTAWQEPWPAEQISDTDVEKFVTSCSRGLAMVVKPGRSNNPTAISPGILMEEDEKLQIDRVFNTLQIWFGDLGSSSVVETTVQLIHESVQDFFANGGLAMLCPGVEDVTSFAHDELKLVCHHFLSVPGRRPLQRYATQYIIYHANEAAITRPQTDFLECVQMSDSVRTALTPITRSRTVRPSLFSFDLGYLDAADWDVRFDEDVLKTRLQCEAEVLERFRAESKYGIAHALVLAGSLRLISQAPASCRLDHGGCFSPLMMAAVLGLGDAVDALLDAKVDIEENHGGTALHFATYLEPSGFDLCKRLRSNPEALDDQGRTVLLCATSNVAPVSIVSLLLERGADVNARDRHGRTPLMCSVGNHGSIAVTRLLLAHNAFIDAQDIDGMTCAMTAALSNQDSVLLALIDHGANLFLMNNFGQTALDLSFLDESSARTRDILLQAMTLGAVPYGKDWLR